ncbi:hypothetical protein L208DRAFT_469720 [Tricholoma matsutake]|nr:hypothetical protein L208DRAFT_469720 [Tricholoma matsutake 945]
MSDVVCFQKILRSHMNFWLLKKFALLGRCVVFFSFALDFTNSFFQKYKIPLCLHFCPCFSFYFCCHSFSIFTALTAFLLLL